MTERKTLRDYLLEGGVKGRKFGIENDNYKIINIKLQPDPTSSQILLEVLEDINTLGSTPHRCYYYLTKHLDDEEYVTEENQK